MKQLFIRGAGQFLVAKFKAVIRLGKQNIVEIVLFSMVFFSGAYFYNGMNWNQISRYDAIFSFVEPNSPDYLTFQIDHFISNPRLGINTGDWAQNPEHKPGGKARYYSNKAPGPMLLGIPLYFVIYSIEDSLGYIPEAAQWTVVNCYLLNLLLTVLPVALSSIFFYRIVLTECNGRRHWALALTVGLYFGTLIFPYSTNFWAHATAAAFVVMGLYFFMRDRPLAYVLCGLLLGLGVLTEYSVPITLFSLLVVLLCRRHYNGLLGMGLGGLLPFITFIAYNKMCFGKYITLANFHNNPGFIDEGAVGGLFSFKTILQAGWGISFSPYRGLFWYMPILLVVLVAGLALIWRGRRHWLYWVCLGNILAFFLMNITFNGWHGGACMGPRYQIPVLPFYLLLGCLLANSLSNALWRRRLFITFCLVAALSVSNMFICTVVSPFAKQRELKKTGWENPLPRYYRGLLQFNGLHVWGKESLRAEAGLKKPTHRSFNLGQLLGLKKASSLLPWFFVMLALTALLAWRWPRLEHTPRDGSAGEPEPDTDET